MFSFRKKAQMPDRAQALPGRAESDARARASPRQRQSPGRTLSARDCAWRMFGLGCFWGAERKFWQLPGVYSTAVGYAGRLHAEPNLRGSLLRLHRRTMRWCEWSTTRRRSATSSC